MNSESKNKSLELYYLKRTVNELKMRSSINGSTSLISLHIPPTTQLTEFSNLLKNEYGTASNIKDKKTGKAVMEAIQSILARIHSYSNGENGLIIFSGHTAEAGKVEFFAINPPRKVTIKTYRCESSFITEHLEAMLESREKVGIIAIGRSGATFAMLAGSAISILETKRSYVQSKHGKGGQSAQRIERGIEIQAQEFFGKMATISKRIYIDENEIKYLLVGGPSISKDQFISHKKFEIRLKKKIYKTYDVGYIDEQGIKEIINLAQGDLEDIELIKEKKLMSEFLSELAKDSGKTSYGENEVTSLLERAAVEVVLFSDKVNKKYFYSKCKKCDSIVTRSFNSDEALGYKTVVKQEKCDTCGMAFLEIQREESLIEKLEELSNKTGARIEVISASHELGDQLYKGFTGIAAILRYPVNE